MKIADAERIYERVLKSTLLKTAMFHRDKLSLIMDFMCMGANGNPAIDVDRLMKVSDVDFAHDVMGVYRHLNRNTGILEDNFVPRCSMEKPIMKTIALTFTVEQLTKVFREQGIDVTDDQMVQLLMNPDFVKTLTHDFFIAWSSATTAEFSEIFGDFLTFDDDGEVVV
jgi:hypothetical protein